MTTSFIAPLPAWGLIHASGPDAESFLHGQLTNDLLHLGATTAQWNGYCTAKGRMLASFLVWRDGGDGFFLATDNALTPALTKRLRMFVLRAKAVIEDVSEAFACFGIARAVTGLDAATPALAMSVAQSDSAWYLSLPPIDGARRRLAYVPRGAAASFAVAQSLAASDAIDWTRLMIHAGEAWITPATQEAFVPQMINFDAIGGINFKKGCYPGQEIVARAHYRGAVKRRMFRAHVEAEAQAGAALFGASVGGQECGMIALAAPGENGGSDVLAVVQMQAQADGVVRLGAADGPVLTFGALPYVIQTLDDMPAVAPAASLKDTAEPVAATAPGTAAGTAA